MQIFSKKSLNFLYAQWVLELFFQNEQIIAQIDV